MNNEFSDLQNAWQSQIKERNVERPSFQQLVAEIENKSKKGLSFHYWTVFILIGTIIGLISFFYFVAPVQEIMSRIGVGLMTIGLALRVAIEIGSALRSAKINKLDTTLNSTKATLAFYAFREKVHGALTHIIFGLYIVGFYLISPEFSLYFSLEQMILMDVSFFVIIAFIYLFIRKEIRKEMKMLRDVIELKKEIEQS